MKNNSLICLSFFLITGSISAFAADTDLVVKILNSPDKVGKNEVLEVRFIVEELDFKKINPFNPNLKEGDGFGYAHYLNPGINVMVSFRKPWGDWSEPIRHPAFYYGPEGDHQDVWKFRFAPKESGQWEYRIEAEIENRKGQSDIKPFQVSVSSNPGLVTINPKDGRFFQFESGQPFVPLGSGFTGLTGGAVALLEESGKSSVMSEMSRNGMNFARLFWSVVNLDSYGTGAELDLALCKRLNLIQLNHTKVLDQVFRKANHSKIYIQYVMEDWSKLRPLDEKECLPQITALKRKNCNSNPYISCKGKNASSWDEFFTHAMAREIYKRKLRYFIARYGAYTSLMSIELLNSMVAMNQGDVWHVEMADYIHTVSPYLKHLVTSSYGNDELRLIKGGIPFDHPSLDYVNFHTYPRQKMNWNFSKLGSVNPAILDKMGSVLNYPWMDTAVLTDRIYRVIQNFKWNKPVVFSEFGLINTLNGWEDWNQAYTLDKSGWHIRNAIWVAALYGSVLSHWKLDYIGGFAAYPPSKLQVFFPLSEFLKDVDFTGMRHETTYPVSDPANPNPQVASNNIYVMAVTMHDASRAYVYVKNLTSMWASINPPEFPADVNLPVQLNQTAEIRISGMEQGSYTLETFKTSGSTLDAIRSVSALNVGADGVVKISVADLSDDLAYKLARKTAASSASSTASSSASVSSSEITSGQR